VLISRGVWRLQPNYKKKLFLWRLNFFGWTNLGVLTVPGSRVLVCLSRLFFNPLCRRQYINFTMFPFPHHFQYLVHHVATKYYQQKTKTTISLRLSKIHTCAATLLNKRYALSAYHCIVAEGFHTNDAVVRFFKLNSTVTSCNS
jgi:hypothetical protein